MGRKLISTEETLFKFHEKPYVNEMITYGIQYFPADGKHGIIYNHLPTTTESINQTVNSSPRNTGQERKQ